MVVTSTERAPTRKLATAMTETSIQCGLIEISLCFYFVASEFFSFLPFIFSEVDKVPVGGLSLGDKGKDGDKEGEKDKQGNSPITASPTTQSDAVTQ